MADIRSRLVVVPTVLLLLLAACGDDTAGGGGAGGGGGDDATSSTGSTSTSTTSTGGAACGSSLDHCSAGLFHCTNDAASFFTCAEYGAADASTFEKICNDGGGTWAAGCCDEAGALGQCLPATACQGMGIGFEYADAAGAEESCRSTGGTWSVAP